MKAFPEALQRMKLNLSNFEVLFQAGIIFSITEEEYQTQTGKTFPQRDYFQKRSPLAYLAKRYGYEIILSNNNKPFPTIATFQPVLKDS